MRSSIRLGRIKGIPFKVHISFLFILPFFAIVFGFTHVPDILGFQLGFDNLPISWPVKLGLGLIASILFFTAVLLHELAHSLMAIRHGYKISGITLFIFGGATEIERQPKDAVGEGIMAFVGPATSLIIGVVLLPIWFLLRDAPSLGINIIAIMVSMMSFYNILLAGFNLIPAFPMDGGRILRSFLARRIGFIPATRTAVVVGKAIAIGMAIFGFFYNIWLILIALFIYLGAKEEEKSTLIGHTLEGITIGNVMTSDVSVVPPTMVVRELLDKIMMERHIGYPVVHNDHVVGIVTLHDVQGIPASHHYTTEVGQIMSRNVVSVGQDIPAMDALQIMARQRIGRLLVMEDQILIGIVTRSDIIRMLEIRSMERGIPLGRG
ncbi:MAG: CBS domain-containing protein [Euryarchaeota archaeon]|nr:CBS domain-containing protein [Euryarchaeota archaeon]